MIISTITKRGFTLIELLVVISIVALLSSVVLSSLNAARTKAGDAAVKAAMKQMLVQAQNYLDTNNLTSFGTASNCTSGLFAETRFAQQIANVASNDAAGSSMTCYSSGNNWALSVSALKSGGSWCVDNNQGWFKAGTAQSTGLCQ